MGLIVEMMGGDETVVGGTVPQRIASCMEALGALLALPHAVGASLVLADKRRAAAAPAADLVHAVANILGQSRHSPRATRHAGQTTRGRLVCLAPHPGRTRANSQ